MRTFPFRPSVIAISVAAMAAAMQPALADPAAPQVRNGAANVTGIGTGAVTVTATSNTTLIQWQSFQVGAGQSVNFVLPSAASTVLNQVIGAASFQGRVAPMAQVMFQQNNYVSGGTFTAPFDLANASLGMLQLDHALPAAPRRADLAEGAMREIVATLADGQVAVMALARDDVSTTASGELLLAAGRSIELSDRNNPGINVLVTAPVGRALNVSQLLARARSTGMFGVMLAQPKPARRSDTEAAHQLARMRESRDAVDTLIAYLDDAASRIARQAEPVSDLLSTALASGVAPPVLVPVQLASVAPVTAFAAGAQSTVPVQDLELMEAQVSSWQLAVAPQALPVDTELMESRVNSWQLAVAPLDTELMEMQVSSWQLAVAPQALPVDTELMESRVTSWQLAVAPLDTELMEMQVSSWQLAVAPQALPVDTELMESRVNSWQLAVAPLDTELMEMQVSSWQLAVAPPALPIDTELMESRVTSWQLAVSPVPAAAVVAAVTPRDIAPTRPAVQYADKPVQVAAIVPGEAPRIILPERRITPPKLIRIEYKGGSFFM